MAVWVRWQNLSPLASSDNSLHNSHTPQTSNNKDCILEPHLVSYTVIDTVKRVLGGDCLFVADGDADIDIASLAIHRGCPVLSNDSDFYIFPLQYGYIPYSKFYWSDPRNDKIYADIYFYDLFCRIFFTNFPCNGCFKLFLRPGCNCIDLLIINSSIKYQKRLYFTFLQYRQEVFYVSCKGHVIPTIHIYVSTDELVIKRTAIDNQFTFDWYFTPPYEMLIDKRCQATNPHDNSSDTLNVTKNLTTVVRNYNKRQQGRITS